MQLANLKNLPFEQVIFSVLLKPFSGRIAKNEKLRF